MCKTCNKLKKKNILLAKTKDTTAFRNIWCESSLTWRSLNSHLLRRKCATTELVETTNSGQTFPAVRSSRPSWSSSASAVCICKSFSFLRPSHVPSVDWNFLFSNFCCQQLKHPVFHISIWDSPREPSTSKTSMTSDHAGWPIEILVCNDLHYNPHTTE